MLNDVAGPNNVKIVIAEGESLLINITFYGINALFLRFFNSELSFLIILIFLEFSLCLRRPMVFLRCWVNSAVKISCNCRFTSPSF